MATNKKTAPKTSKKDNKTLKIVLIVVGVLLGLGIISTVLIILFFSAVFHKVANDAGVGIDTNNGTLTVKSDDGQSTATYGEGATLADGFPSDVPVFTPSTLLASSKTNDNEYSAVARTASSVADVTSFYKSQMASQGWTTELDSSSSGSSLLSFKKDTRTSTVVVTQDTEESSNEKTGFVVTVSSDMNMGM